MNKPRGVRRLEEQTGEVLERRPIARDHGRHLSLRIPASLLSHLEQMAVERGETVSQVARRLLGDGIARVGNPDRDAIDSAIAALEQLRRRLGPPAA